MTKSPIAANFGIQGSLAGFYYPDSHFSSPATPVVWKTLVVFTILLFSLVYLPRYEASETKLTGTNLLNALNADRLRNGLTPLEENPQLLRAAYAKAQDILKNNYFAHTSPTGVKPWDFIKSEGFAYAFAGENLAINYQNAQELEQDFLKSPSHRENLLSPLFSAVGIAVVKGVSRGQSAIVTVQMFAAPPGPLARR